MPGRPISKSWPAADSPRQLSNADRRRKFDPKSPSFQPGRLLMLPQEYICRKRGWVREDEEFPHPGVFNHPVAMIGEDGDEILIVILSSINDRYLDEKGDHVRMQHLPIHPSPPHPDTRELLRINGSTDKPCYLKVHETYWFSRKLFGTNTDRESGQELMLDPASLALVIRAVNHFKHDRCTAHAHCRAGKETPENSLRPYPDMPETLGPVPGTRNGVTPRLPSPSPPRRPNSWSHPGQQHYQTPPPRHDRVSHQGSWRHPSSAPWTRNSPPHQCENWRVSPTDPNRSRSPARHPKESPNGSFWGRDQW